MILSLLDNLTAGRFWVLKCLPVLLFFTLLFTCSPALLSDKEILLPPAYEVKSLHPFADTSLLKVPIDKGEQSHGAKLTPRLFGSILLFVATKLSLHPYIPASIGGIAFLLSGILVGYQISTDRITGFFLGLMFAGLYASSAAFANNFMPKPFDGIAIGLIALTAASVGRPWLFTISAFLSYWTDERSVLSIVFISMFILLLPTLDERSKKSRCIILASTVIAYAAVRYILANALHWNPPDMSMIGTTVPTSLPYLQLTAWTCFEGGWIALGAACWMLSRKNAIAQLVILAGSICLAVMSCLLVLDTSRAASFAFPLIFVAFAVLKREDINTHEFRVFSGAGAIVSLLVPNFEIVAGTMLKCLRPFSAYLLEYLLR